MISIGAWILHVTASGEWRTKLFPTIRSIPLFDFSAVPQKYELVRWQWVGWEHIVLGILCLTLGAVSFFLE